MFDEFMDKLFKCDIKGMFYEKLGEVLVMYIQLGQVMLKIDFVKMIVDQICKEISEWVECGEDMFYIQCVCICCDCMVVIDFVWEVVELFVNVFGGLFVNCINMFNWVWQDVKVVLMYLFLLWMMYYENYGCMLVGVQLFLIFV